MVTPVKNRNSCKSAPFVIAIVIVFPGIQAQVTESALTAAMSVLARAASGVVCAGTARE